MVSSNPILDLYMSAITKILEKSPRAMTAAEIRDEFPYDSRHGVIHLIREHGERYGINRVKNHKAGSRYFYYLWDEQLQPTLWNTCIIRKCYWCGRGGRGVVYNGREFHGKCLEACWEDTETKDIYRSKTYRKNELLEILDRPCTVRELASAMKLSKTSIYDYLRELHREGKVDYVRDLKKGCLIWRVKK